MKTASRITGTAAALEGYYVQDFPLYGAERRGAPLTAYTRISEKTILERGVITNPHIVIIADESLLDDPMADPLRGTDNGTIIIINSQGHPDSLERFNLKDRPVLFIDATGISLAVIGRETAISGAMGAAACRASGVIKKASLTEAVTRELTSIGISSEDVLQKNIDIAGKCFDSLHPTEKHKWNETPPSEAETVTMPYEPPALSTPGVLAAGNIVERQTGRWRTFRPVIDYEKCNHCWICFVWCPDGVISLDNDDAPHIDYDHCKGCLICYEECPVKAITVEREEGL